MSNFRKLAGFFLVIWGIAVLFFTFYASSRFSNTTRVFSPRTLLVSSWEEYRSRFINKDGRVIDESSDNITTSEGQSYAMLRSVWIDDKETFDLVWKFTQENMQRPNDHLFGWRWGKRSDGEFGFIEPGGDNSAADGDSDIALALILASRRWNDQKYSDQAREILKDIWNYETDVAAGNRYLIAGNWAKNDNEVVINPSYFIPYAWRIFSTVDTENDWLSLVDPAYSFLYEAGKEPLDKSQSVGLPPDWVVVNKGDGRLSAATSYNLSSNYSFDAVRIPWRIALDYQWNKTQKAREYLGSLHFLDQQFSNNKLFSGYTHDGVALNEAEHPTMYSTAIGYFIVNDHHKADKIYEDKIIKLYSNAENNFNDDIPYYEQNWLWFGAALYNNFLVPFDESMSGKEE